jgi:hypothetical protein
MDTIGSELFRVQHVSDTRGRGIVCCQNISAGTTVLVESPLAAIQHVANKEKIFGCDMCSKYLGSIKDQVNFLSDKANIKVPKKLLAAMDDYKDPLYVALSPVVCDRGCGIMYCSDACKQRAWGLYHNKLCVGDIEDENHPLYQLKIHAMETNEIFGLAAKVVAIAIYILEREGLDKYKQFMQTLVTKHSPVWWEIIPVDESMSVHDATQYREEFKKLAEESYALLQGSLLQYSQALLGESDDFSFSFFSKLIGCFESNNYTIEIPSPVAMAVKCVKNKASESNYTLFLESLKPVLETLKQRLDELDECDEEEGDDDGGHGHSHGEGGHSHDAHMEEAVDGDDIELEAEDDFVDRVLPKFEGVGLFDILSMMNHSCNPNVEIRYTKGNNTAQVVALRDLYAGEEMEVSYIDNLAPYAERQEDLKSYGFTCTCEHCAREKL